MFSRGLPGAAAPECTQSPLMGGLENLCKKDFFSAQVQACSEGLAPEGVRPAHGIQVAPLLLELS